MLKQIIRFSFHNQFAQYHQLSILQQDKEITNILNQVKKQQIIDFTETPLSLASQQCLQSILSSKYASGYPEKRNKPGTQVYDKIELLCQERLLQYFNLNKNEIEVNVQVQSIGAGFFISLRALVEYIETNQIKSNNSVKMFGQFPYLALNKYYQCYDTQPFYQLYNNYYDWTQTLNNQNIDNKVVILNVSNYAPFIQEELIKHQDKWDILLCSTETFFGPKGCVLLYKKKYSEFIQKKCYPGYQSGPHFHTIAGITVALNEVLAPSYQIFKQNIIENCISFKQFLTEQGFNVKIELPFIVIETNDNDEFFNELIKNDIIIQKSNNGQSLIFNMQPICYKGITENLLKVLVNLLSEIKKINKNQKLIDELKNNYFNLLSQLDY